MRRRVPPHARRHVVQAPAVEDLLVHLAPQHAATPLDLLSELRVEGVEVLPGAHEREERAPVLQESLRACRAWQRGWVKTKSK